MLKIFSLMIFLFCSSAEALPFEVFLPLNGDFALSEHMEVTQLKRFEKVDALTTVGSRRLQQLKAEGYTCAQHTALHWVCTKTFPAQTLSGKLADQIQKKWAGLLISFREASEAPMMVEERGEIQVWTATQKVFVRTGANVEPKTWNQVSYIYNPKDVLKECLIYLGDYRDADAPVLRLVDKHTILVQDVVDVVGANSTLRYFVDLYISRIQ